MPISHSNVTHGIVLTKSDFLWQVNGGPEKYQGGEEWDVDEIVSVCTARKNPTYLVRWAGYDSTYQTWEKAENIAPALLKAFHARIACPVRLEQPMHEMREAVAQTHLYASPTLMYTYCTPSFRGGTTPGPQARPNTCAPLAYLSLWLLTLQVRTGDSWGCTRRGLARSVRSHRERFNGTILELASLRLGFRLSSRAFRTMCARPFSPPPFALTAAQPSPPAPLHMCRVQPKHPCIACRTHPARAVLVPRPEHAHTHRPPCRPHAACAYVSGPGWRLPECEKTFFGAISTCASALFQRCHARVRLLPCVVASCCLLWCLALWPVRG